MWAQTLFGENLVTKSGPKKTVEHLANKKRVGIYFSAHWCPPCRRFTPMLAEFYNDVQAEDADELEIIFVSSDSDMKSFLDYYGEMPWSSAEYDGERTQQISSEYDVKGIPTFVVLDGATGKTLDADARSTVSANTSALCLSKWV
jgi:nucleoredoxin